MTLLKADRYVKISSVEKVKNVQKVDQKKLKNGFNSGKERYLCENYSFNYTGTKWISYSAKYKALRCYL